MTTATILHTQRLSTEDGPGIRTTVFFKGCPLRCEWCHNPESLTGQPQVQWLEDRCTGCNTCLEACTYKGLERRRGEICIDRSRCDGCGRCAKACPSGALELLGRPVTVQALLAELLKDRAYYQASNGGSPGGVTLSGGEPTLQSSFVEELLIQLKAAGIHTALDTCGLVARPVLERLLPYVDLVLFDVKLLDPELHLRYTGQDNRLILENLAWLCDKKRELPCELWVRTPLIPGATANQENLSAIGAWLWQVEGIPPTPLGRGSQEGNPSPLRKGGPRGDSCISRWDLCAFNNLCRDKYRRLGLDWPYAGASLMTQEEIKQCAAWAGSSGFPEERIFF